MGGQFATTYSDCRSYLDMVLTRRRGGCRSADDDAVSDISPSENGIALKHAGSLRTQDRHPRPRMVDRIEHPGVTLDLCHNPCSHPRIPTDSENSRRS